MSPAAAATTDSRLPIRVLGELQVGRADALLALPASRKTRALLAYLAVTGRRHRRSELCALFWEDAADPRAGLRWSLTQLRQALGDAHRDLIRADRDAVALRIDRIDSDLAPLAALVRPAAGTGGGALAQRPRDALAGALARFRGEFLEGLDLPACYAYHEWCLAEREAASRTRERLLEALIEHDRGQPAQQLAHARALVALNPLSEAGHVESVRALVALGRLDDARAQRTQCGRIFEAELGLQPPAALDALLAAAGAARRRGAEPSGASPAPTLDAPAARPPAAPFVGREQEAAELAAGIARLGRGDASDVLLLSGVPGIGKSRLLDELARQVMAAGGQVLRGRAFEGERLRPYGFWIDALRGMGLDKLPAALRAALQPLWGSGPAAVPRGERERLFDAVRDVLALHAQAGPVAVLVDDLQWIEDASAALLHYAMRQLAGSAVLFALGARGGELEDNAPAQQLVAALAGEGRLRRLALGPLGDEDARVLARGVHGAGDVERIVARAQGHPMMLIELARSAGASDDAAGTLDRLLETRLAGLSPAAAELLGWACAFGHSVPLEALIASQGGGLAALAPALSELERHDLLHADGADRYAFSHDLVQEAAYGRIAQPRRRLMHRTIALALGREIDASPASAAEVAHHAGLGGQHALAARAAVVAGEHGLRLGASREAAEVARRGRRQAGQVPDKAQRARLGMALLRIQILASSSPTLARLRPGVETIALAIDEARARRLHDEVAQGHYLLSIVHQEAGRLDAAQRATLHAAEAAQRSDRLCHARQLANSARCLVEIGRDVGHARALVGQALALADAAGEQEIELLWCQGLLQHWDGELGPAVASLDRAIALAAREEDRWRQGRCLAAAAMIELERQSPGAALARAEVLAQATQGLGDGAEGPLAVALAAIARRMAAGPAPPVAAALEDLRAADDKSRLAAVLNAAAAAEQSRHDGAAAGAYAAEALAVAQAIGDRSEAVVARAILARPAPTGADGPTRADHALALQAVLDAPEGFSVRATRAAQDALAHWPPRPATRAKAPG